MPFLRAAEFLTVRAVNSGLYPKKLLNHHSWSGSEISGAMATHDFVYQVQLLLSLLQLFGTIACRGNVSEFNSSDEICLILQHR